MTDSEATIGAGPGEPGAGRPGSPTGQPEAGRPGGDGGQVGSAAHTGHQTGAPIDINTFKQKTPKEKMQMLMLASNEEVQAILPNLSEGERSLADAILRIREASAEDTPDDERVSRLDPGMTDEMSSHNQMLDDAFSDKEESYILDNIAGYKEILANFFENKGDAVERLQAYNLSPEAINELVSGLPDPEASGEAPELPSEAAANGLTEEGTLHEMNDEASRLADGLPPENELRQRIDAHKVKIAALSRRFKGYFAEGEPGRKYARIGGKIVYFALLAAFIALLLEMNIINKAAGNRSRR